MNDINLYEKIPSSEYQIRFLPPGDSSFFPLHWHEHTEIHFMISGMLKIRCSKKTLQLKKGDCAVINSNELHMALGGKDCLSFKILLPPSFFEHKYHWFDNYIKDETVTNLMFKIMDFAQNEDESSRFIAKGYTYQLIGHLCEHYTLSHLDENLQKRNNHKLDRINTAVEYMHTNYSDEITTEQLSQLACLSQSHFCHIFKDVFSISAKAYLLEIRIKKAAELLSSTNMSVSDISTACGFSNASYFTRAFKKRTLSTPSEYRKERQNQHTY